MKKDLISDNLQETNELNDIACKHKEETNHAELITDIQFHDEPQKIRLHEERARIDIQRYQAGTVSVQKVIQERTEQVPVTLLREVLQITIHEGTDVNNIKGLALLDGTEIVAGQTYEIILSDERAVIQKEVYPVSDVELKKQVQQIEHTEHLQLKCEELQINDPNGLVADTVIK